MNLFLMRKLLYSICERMSLITNYHSPALIKCTGEIAKEILVCCERGNNKIFCYSNK